MRLFLLTAAMLTALTSQAYAQNEQQDYLKAAVQTKTKFIAHRIQLVAMERGLEKAKSCPASKRQLIRSVSLRLNSQNLQFNH